MNDLHFHMTKPDYCYFSYGYPVKESGWNYLKRVFKGLKENPKTEYVLTEDFIIETFSPIQETLSGRNVSSSFDQFKSTCKAHGIQVAEDYLTRNYKIRAYDNRMQNPFRRREF